MKSKNIKITLHDAKDICGDKKLDNINIYEPVKLSILGAEDLWPELFYKGKLEKMFHQRPNVIKKYSTAAMGTDLVKITGGNNVPYDFPFDFHYKRDYSYASRYWTKTSNENDYIYTDDYGAKEPAVYLKTSRDLAIRPVLKVTKNLPKEVLDELKFCTHEWSTVKFGFYPHWVVIKEESDYIDKNKNRLKKTGRTYTLNSLDINNETDSFVPKVYNEYELDNKKFIRVKVNGYRLILSDGSYVNKGDYVWVIVMPVKWFYDKKRGLLISEKALVSGIRYDDILSNAKTFEETELYNYINTYLVHDLFQDILKKEKNETKENKVPEKKITLEENLINEIGSMLAYFENNSQFTSKILKEVNDLLDSYNKKIETLDLDKKLVFSSETIEGAKDELIKELETILETLKVIKNKSAIYYDFLKYLDVLNEALENKYNVPSDPLVKDFYKINWIIAPYLDATECSMVRNKLTNIINGEKERINNYIKSLCMMPKESASFAYDNIDGLELELRKTLHPFLLDLNEMVQKRNLYLEVVVGINEVAKNNFKVAQNSLTSFYVSMINDVYQELQNSYKLTSEEKDRLLAIIKTNVNIDDNLNNVLNQLTIILKNLYEFKYSMQRKNQSAQIKENNYIKVRLLKESGGNYAVNTTNK